MPLTCVFITWPSKCVGKITYHSTTVSTYSRTTLVYRLSANLSYLLVTCGMRMERKQIAFGTCYHQLEQAGEGDFAGLPCKVEVNL